MSRAGLTGLGDVRRSRRPGCGRAATEPIAAVGLWHSWSLSRCPKCGWLPRRQARIGLCADPPTASSLQPGACATCAGLAREGLDAAGLRPWRGASPRRGALARGRHGGYFICSLGRRAHRVCAEMSRITRGSALSFLGRTHRADRRRGPVESAAQAPISPEQCGCDRRRPAGGGLSVATVTLTPLPSWSSAPPARSRDRTAREGP